jgi:hypothetical protein
MSKIWESKVNRKYMGEFAARGSKIECNYGRNRNEIVKRTEWQ